MDAPQSGRASTIVDTVHSARTELTSPKSAENNQSNNQNNNHDNNRTPQIRKAESSTLPPQQDFSSTANLLYSSFSNQALIQDAGLPTEPKLNILKFSLVYNLTHAKKSPCLCCVGIGAILFVVLGIAIAGGVMENLKSVFFRQSELLSGENDFVIRPQRSLTYLTMNYTSVHKTLATNLGVDYTYTSPRFFLSPVSLYSDSHCPSSSSSSSGWFHTTSRDQRYEGTNSSLCSPTSSGGGESSNGPFLSCVAQSCKREGVNPPSVPMYAVNLVKEKAMELGRDFDYTLSSTGILLDKTSAAVLQAQINSTVWVSFYVADILSAFCAGQAGRTFQSEAINSTDASVLLYRYPVISFPLQVEGIVGNAAGKLSNDVSEFAMVNFDSLVKNMIANQHPALDIMNDACKWKNFTMADYATHIYLNLPPDRVSYYKDLNFDSLLKTLVAFCAPAVQLIGFSQIRLRVPLLEDMLLLQYLTMFLGLMINIIIALFTVLSVILIYSLLMITLQQRSFEHGVMRMLGLSRLGVVIMVMVQTFLYSAPGLILGLVFSALVFGLVIAPIFEAQSGLSVSRTIPGNVILQAVVMALIIPVLSSIIPIHHVITQTLRDVLDVRRNTTKAIEFKVSRATTGRVPWWTVTTGSVFFLFGFMIYYLLPLSIASEDLATLLGIFFAIILSMLVGFAVVASNLETFLQKVIIVVVLGWWEKLSIVRIVSKNLATHSVNNRRTTLMFSTSLSFVIFLTSILQLQNESSGYATLADEGAYLTASTDNYEMPVYMSQRVDAILSAAPQVEAHSWVTQGLAGVIGDGIESDQLTHVGRTFKLPLWLVGVTPNFMDVVVPYFKFAGFRFGKDLDLTSSELLYTVRGSQSAMMPSMLKRRLGMTTDEVGVVDIIYDESLYDTPKADQLTDPNAVNSNIIAVSSADLNSGTNQSAVTITHYPIYPLNFVSSSAGVDLSDLPGAESSQTVVSIPVFQQLLKIATNNSDRFRDAINSVRNIPMEKVLVKFVPEATDDDKDLLIAELRGAIGSDLSVFDYRDTQKAVATFRSVITISGAFITAVVLFLCFFSLVSSMFSNIMSQSKEIAILLALGMPKRHVIRVYVHEAFVLVFSSSMIGLLTGTCVAVTMSLQQAVMSGLPIPLYFPWELVLVVFMVGWLLAFLAAYFPAVSMVRRNIVQIMHKFD